MSRPLLALAAGAALVGSITLVHVEGSSSLAAVPVEVPFGVRAPGSSVGVNATNATASVAGSLLSTTTQLWYLNNTNATGPYVAKIELLSSTGLANLASLTVGIDNGTAQTPQVTVDLGVLTGSSGTYVTLPAGGTGSIYATTAVSTLGLGATLSLQVSVADDAQESAVIRMPAQLTVT